MMEEERRILDKRRGEGRGRDEERIRGENERSRGRGGGEGTGRVLGNAGSGNPGIGGEKVGRIGGWRRAV